MADDSLFLIDIDKILQTKAPKHYKYIPKFVVSYLKRIVHQEELNVFLRDSKDKVGVDFLGACLEFLDAKLEVKGLENIPKDGLYTFVSNHPLGGPDGIALISFLGKYYPDLKFPVNDILLNLKNLNNIFLPVNKHGGMSREAVKAIASAYTSDNQIIMFPAGLCSRKIKGKIEDLEWQKNFIVEAVKHQRDIVPIYISGQNSNFFYNLSNFRKRIGLKANIEMLWLPKEAFKKKNETLTLKIGKPISWQSFDKSKKPKEWAKEVREILYRL